MARSRNKKNNTRDTKFDITSTGFAHNQASRGAVNWNPQEMTRSREGSATRPDSSDSHSSSISMGSYASGGSPSPSSLHATDHSSHSEKPPKRQCRRVVFPPRRSSVAPTLGSGKSSRTLAAGSGSGRGSAPSFSDERRTNSGGLNLTEDNVRRTSDFYQDLKVEREKAEEMAGASDRMAFLLDTLADVASKLSDEHW
ncbi:hypothetical protein VTH82DRAFT_3243 [Thermothelomyces myriococcoides]